MILKSRRLKEYFTIFYPRKKDEQIQREVSQGHPIKISSSFLTKSKIQVERVLSRNQGRVRSIV